MLIGSLQRAFHRAIGEPCTLRLSLPTGGTKREFLRLAFPFTSSFQVIVDISNLVCGLNIASPSLGSRDDKLSLTRAWSGHMTHYKILGCSNHITVTAEPKVVKFCTRVGYINSNNYDVTNKRAWLWSRDCIIVSIKFE